MVPASSHLFSHGRYTSVDPVAPPPMVVKPPATNTRPLSRRIPTCSYRRTDIGATSVQPTRNPRSAAAFGALHCGPASTAPPPEPPPIPPPAEPPPIPPPAEPPPTPPAPPSRPQRLFSRHFS